MWVQNSRQAPKKETMAVAAIFSLPDFPSVDTLPYALFAVGEMMHGEQIDNWWIITTCSSMHKHANTTSRRGVAARSGSHA